MTEKSIGGKLLTAFFIPWIEMRQTHDSSFQSLSEEEHWTLQSNLISVDYLAP